MSRYAIWNKTDDIFTPSGEKFAAEQWINRYPIAEIPTVKIVCGGGVLNGAFFGILSEMVDCYTKAGCDFSECTEDQDYLDVIEAFEDERNTPSDEVDAQTEALESIAAQLEYQNMLSTEVE